MIFALNRTKVQMSTPFLRVRPWNFAHVFNALLPSLLRMLFFFSFRRKCGVSLRPEYPKKIQNPKYLTKTTTTKQHSLKARQRYTKHVCKISGSNSKKRRGHLHPKEFWVYAWTSLYIYTYSIILTAMNGGRGWHGHLFLFRTYDWH